MTAEGAVMEVHGRGARPERCRRVIHPSPASHRSATGAREIPRSDAGAASGSRAMVMSGMASRSGKAWRLRQGERT